jgi:hypothetical protein
MAAGLARSESQRNGQGRPSELPTGGPDVTPVLFFDLNHQGAINGKQETGIA